MVFEPFPMIFGSAIGYLLCVFLWEAQRPNNDRFMAKVEKFGNKLNRLFHVKDNRRMKEEARRRLCLVLAIMMFAESTIFLVAAVYMLVT